MYFWTVVKWNVKTKWENEENQVFLNKKDPMAQKKILLNMTTQLRKWCKTDL